MGSIYKLYQKYIKDGDEQTPLGEYSIVYVGNSDDCVDPDDLPIGDMTPSTICATKFWFGDVCYTEDFDGTDSLSRDKVLSLDEKYGVNVLNDLTRVDVGTCITTIYDHAFDQCENLRAATVPDSVTLMGSSFDTCVKLKAVTLSKNLDTTYSNSLFYNCINLKRLNSDIDGVINIPNGFTKISDYMFAANGLNTLIIPDSVRSIGKVSFSYCAKITSITLSQNVETIGEEAFENCIKLKRLNSDENGVFNLPNSIKTIEHSAFYNISNFTSLTIPDSVTSIGAYAFGEWYLLENLTFGSGMKTFDVDMFGDKLYNLTSVTLSSVETIGEWAFYTSTKLKRLNSAVDGVMNLPNTLKTIETSAFRGLKNFHTVNIPNSVTSIGNGAFLDCNIQNLNIGSGVKSIGGSALVNALSTNEITYNGTKAQWDSISKSTAFEYGYTYTVHCTDGDYELTSW